MSWARPLCTATVLMTMFGTCFSAPARGAVDCSTPKPGLGVSLGNVFNLNLSGFSSSEATTAINYWDCPGFAVRSLLSRLAARAVCLSRL